MSDASLAAGPANSREARIALKQVWRDSQSSDRACDLRIGIAASFTANWLVPFLGGHLLSAGHRPDIVVGPYGQLHQVCLAPHSAFGQDCGTIILLWRIEDLMLDEVMASLDG